MRNMQDLRGAKFPLSGPDDSYPALKCARLLGLRDIGVNWRMPDNLTMSETEASLWDNGILDCHIDLQLRRRSGVASLFNQAADYADAFTALNPDLKSVSFNRDLWRDMRGFIHGVVSGFNLDDITLWVKDDFCEKERARKLTEKLHGRIIAEYHKPLEKSRYPQELRMAFMKQQQIRILSDRELSCVRWAPHSRTVEKISRQLDAKWGASPLSL